MSFFKRYELCIVIFLIFLLTLASRIVVRILLLNVSISRGPEYVIGIPGFALFIIRIYQLALPFYIAWAIILGVIATLVRLDQNEPTYTKLFLLSILDMLAALLGEILYLVLEYSKTWFSLFGFSKLGEFLGIMMPLFTELPFPLIPSILLLSSELCIIFLLKYSPIANYLSIILYDKGLLSRLVKLFTYIRYEILSSHTIDNALIFSFVVSLVICAVIAIVNETLANTILTYTFWLLVVGIIWKFVSLIKEEKGE